jgi:hypothetical protein
MTDKPIELKVASPVPGPDSLNSWFALYLPTQLEAGESFDTIVEHIEFRRKCMNQGFDNLLELLAMTRTGIEKDVAARKAKEANEQAEPGNA